jgi:hypothetical protein
VGVFEFFDTTVTLPKLYIVAVNQQLIGSKNSLGIFTSRRSELLGIFFRRVIVWADQLDCPKKATVYADNVSAVLCHLRHPCRRKFLPVIVHKKRNASARSRTLKIEFLPVL